MAVNDNECVGSHTQLRRVCPSTTHDHFSLKHEIGVDDEQELEALGIIILHVF